MGPVSAPQSPAPALNTTYIVEDPSFNISTEFEAEEPVHERFAMNFATILTHMMDKCRQILFAEMNTKCYKILQRCGRCILEFQANMIFN